MNKNYLSRRHFLQTSAAFAAVASIPAMTWGKTVIAKPENPFGISLAEWSLHKALQKKEMDHMDFPKKAKELEIDAIELVNQFFKDKAKDEKYLGEFKKKSADDGVKILLIMVDGEGHLGDPDQAKRTIAVENHYKWVDAAKFLGCHSIRVNAASKGEYDEQVKLAADGLGKLSEYGAKNEINVIVENHGGLSSNGEWLAKVMKTVDNPRCGTLPDFGNFWVNVKHDQPRDYDMYKGVDEMMPFAKAVSAKSYDFDDKGNEVKIDFHKMMDIVLKHGYHGYVGIEYEGHKLSEIDGIKATRDLLLSIRKQIMNNKK